jgi:hypothetical protein
VKHEWRCARTWRYGTQGSGSGLGKYSIRIPDRRVNRLIILHGFSQSFQGNVATVISIPLFFKYFPFYLTFYEVYWPHLRKQQTVVKLSNKERDTDMKMIMIIHHERS